MLSQLCLRPGNPAVAALAKEVRGGLVRVRGTLRTADAVPGLPEMTEVMKYLFRWALLAFFLHGLWEVAHLPLYTLWEEPERQRVVLYLLHCLAGDVLTASSVYLVAAAVLRDFYWPVHRPLQGGAIIVVTGVVFTGFSEWYNVYQTHAWSYSEAMPLVFGVGLSPLLQCIVVSTLMVVIAGRWNRRT